MSVSGNIGFYNQKGVIGFVIVSLVILLVFMLWVGGITLVICTIIFHFLEQIYLCFLIVVIKVGLPVVVLLMVMRGY